MAPLATPSPHAPTTVLHRRCHREAIHLPEVNVTSHTTTRNASSATGVATKNHQTSNSNRLTRSRWSSNTTNMSRSEFFFFFWHLSIFSKSEYFFFSDLSFSSTHLNFNRSCFSDLFRLCTLDYSLTPLLGLVPLDRYAFACSSFRVFSPYEHSFS